MMTMPTTKNKQMLCVYAWTRQVFESNWSCLNFCCRKLPSGNSLNNACKKFLPGVEISSVTMLNAWKFMGYGFHDVDSICCIALNMTVYDMHGNWVLDNNRQKRLSVPELLYSRILGFKVGDNLAGGIIEKTHIQRIQDANRSYWFGNINRLYGICEMIGLAVQHS